MALENPRPIVAYLILAHANPEQLARLVGTLPRESPVLIHFDRRADPALYDRARELLSSTQFVERHTCRWGDVGIVKGTMSLIDTLVSSGKRYDHACLLSGSDYPIKSNNEIADFLARHQGEEHIESFDVSLPNRWSGHGGLYKTPEKVLGRHVRFRSRVWRMPGLRKPPLGLRVHGGSQWWCLSRNALEHISKFVRDHPRLIDYFARSFIPDESFIQTIVSNSPLRDRVTGDDLRLAIWDRPKPPYPAILKIDDFALLAASPKLHARKFDIQQDAIILDWLDQKILESTRSD